jgi:hypothetical protein
VIWIESPARSSNCVLCARTDPAPGAQAESSAV